MSNQLKNLFGVDDIMYLTTGELFDDVLMFTTEQLNLPVMYLDINSNKIFALEQTWGDYKQELESDLDTLGSVFVYVSFFGILYPVNHLVFKMHLPSKELTEELIELPENQPLLLIEIEDD